MPFLPEILNPSCCSIKEWQNSDTANLKYVHTLLFDLELFFGIFLAQLLPLFEQWVAGEDVFHADLLLLLPPLVLPFALLHRLLRLDLLQLGHQRRSVVVRVRVRGGVIVVILEWVIRVLRYFKFGINFKYGTLCIYETREAKATPTEHVTPNFP